MFRVFYYNNRIVDIKDHIYREREAISNDKLQPAHNDNAEPLAEVEVGFYYLNDRTNFVSISRMSQGALMA